MAVLILIRHGQSLWNQANLFTGWVDVPLSDRGRKEAIHAGQLLADQPIDLVFTSTLIRAQQTAMLILNEHHSQTTPILTHDDPRLKQWSRIHSAKTQRQCLPVHVDWRLNERYYGDLQGMDKDEARSQFGAEQVHVWRRSFDTPPPNGESLKMTAERTLPCFKERILPELEQGKNILLSAHGNSLRSIVMDIEQLNQEQVLNLELATGTPRSYQYQNNEFQKINFIL